MSPPQKQASEHGKEATQKACQPVPGFQGPEALLEDPASLALKSALTDPAMATPAGILALQKAAGNRAVQRLVAQRQAPEEEEELQMMPIRPQPQAQALATEQVQRMGLEGGAVSSRVEPAATRPAAVIDNPVVQRHCWAMDKQEEDSFVEKGEDLIHPFGGPGGEAGEAAGEGQYFRLQPDASDSPSGFYGIWTPKYDQVAEDKKVDKSERAILAVRREWVKTWNFLVKYRGGRAGYFGTTKDQKDKDGTYYQGGAPQVVFPKAAKPRKVDAYPVVEKEK